ncbi:glycosyltransferase family 2 protein [Mycobacterium sp. NPDC048908]|uniref:glycosyltransferase family 2 protein n=1 Tax=Mycobacterium sp. NPDC048908 TaxID=3364292 RepID=UPI00371E9AC6
MSRTRARYPAARSSGSATDWLLGETVSVVIPALNESANLKHVLPRIPNWVHQVILVDDGSTDGTPHVARQLMPGIQVVANWRPRGKGNALRTGFDHADGSLIVQIDADGSEAPEEIIRFVAALLSGAEVAKGSRFLTGGGTSDMTLMRKLGNTGFLRLCGLLYGVRWTDFCHGYIGFRASALRRLELDASGFDIEAQIVLRAADRGLAICEVPCFEHARVAGKGHLRTFPDGWRVLKRIAQEKYGAGHRR